MATKDEPGKPARPDRSPIDDFLDELDQRVAATYRRRLGTERKLVSIEKVGETRWRACLSAERFKRLRFVREGASRIRAMENANKAYLDLLRLLLSRGRLLLSDEPPTTPDPKN